MLNNCFDLDLPDPGEKVLHYVVGSMVNNEQMQLATRANDMTNTGHRFVPALKDALVDHHAENGQFVALVFCDGAPTHGLSVLMLGS